MPSITIQDSQTLNNRVRAENAVNQIINAPILTELPQADASKAGQQFWLNGTLWTYARDGQFGALAEGEPFPVKGYKEYNSTLTLTASGLSAVERQNNLFDDIVFEKGSTGEYVIKTSNEFNVLDLSIFDGSFRAVGSSSVAFLKSISIRNDGGTGNKTWITINLYDDTFTLSNVASTAIFDLSIKLYPPAL